MKDQPFFTSAMGARLRSLRVQAFLTQDEVAERMGREDVRGILATTRPATAVDVGFYPAVAREVLGWLWQQAKQGWKPPPLVPEEFLAARHVRRVTGDFDRDAITRVQTQTIRRFGRLRADHPELFPSGPESRKSANQD